MVFFGLRAGVPRTRSRAAWPPFSSSGRVPRELLLLEWKEERGQAISGGLGTRAKAREGVRPKGVAPRVRPLRVVLESAAHLHREDDALRRKNPIGQVTGLRIDRLFFDDVKDADAADAAELDRENGDADDRREESREPETMTKKVSCPDRGAQQQRRSPGKEEPDEDEGLIGP